MQDNFWFGHKKIGLSGRGVTGIGDSELSSSSSSKQPSAKIEFRKEIPVGRKRYAPPPGVRSSHKLTRWRRRLKEIASKKNSMNCKFTE